MRKLLILVPGLLVFFINVAAQKHLYLVPETGFYSGAYSGVDSLNDTQSYIRTKPFLGKDGIISALLVYYDQPWRISAGVQSGNYSSGYKHKESRDQYPYTISKESTSQGSIIVYFAEVGRELIDLNLEKPRWLFHSISPDRPYLFTSTLAPFVGAEFRRLSSTFVNDYHEGSVIMMTSEDIPGENWFHVDSRSHVSLRAGIDWVFYNLEKERFVITVMYQFAFSNAGYFRYHFNKPGVADFYYQNNTRGNGLTVKIAFPILLKDFSKHK